MADGGRGDEAPRRVPLARPEVGLEALDGLKAVLASGQLVKGPMVARMERRIAQRVGRAHAVACASGTSALTLLLRALDVPAGARVVVPAFTFVGVAHAVLDAGARPVLVDVRPTDLALNVEQTCREIEAGAWAVIAVDPFGLPIDLSALQGACDSKGAILIEDAACALGSVASDGAPAGSRGPASCLSFHPRKIVTTGEGGMILTDDDELAGRLRGLVDHGLDRSAGHFAFAGVNARLSELAGALGLASLDRLDEVVARRNELVGVYEEALGASRQGRHLRLVGWPEAGAWNVQTLVAALEHSALRAEPLRETMRADGVEAGAIAQDLTAQPSTSGHADRACPVAGHLLRSCLALPMHSGLTPDDVRHVVGALDAAIETELRS